MNQTRQPWVYARSWSSHDRDDGDHACKGQDHGDNRSAAADPGDDDEQEKKRRTVHRKQLHPLLKLQKQHYLPAAAI